MSSVTSRSRPNSLTEVILKLGATSVPFSQLPSSLVSKNTRKVTDTFAGFEINSTRSVRLAASIITGATFISSLDTDSVQIPSLRCTMNVPASSISSLNSNPLESVAITSTPIAPDISGPHSTPDPFSESLSQTVPSIVLALLMYRSVSVT